MMQRKWRSPRFSRPGPCGPLGGETAAVTVAFVLFLAPDSANAHIRLDEPTSRYPHPEPVSSMYLKDGPCGNGDDSRTTDATRVTTFRPGETITVSWHETVHHDSHYRIAFDADGQDDFSDPTDEDDIVDPPELPILLDGIPDETSSPDTFSVQVTLPDVTCENCTLQLIQYMYGRQDPFYYQCADLVLADGTDASGRAGASAMDPDSTAEPDSGESDFTDSTTSPPATSTGGQATSEPTETSASPADTPAGGCSFDSQPGDFSRASWWIFALSVAAVWRARRQRLKAS